MHFVCNSVTMTKFMSTLTLKRLSSVSVLTVTKYIHSDSVKRQENANCWEICLSEKITKLKLDGEQKVNLTWCKTEQFWQAPTVASAAIGKALGLVSPGIMIRPFPRPSNPCLITDQQKTTWRRQDSYKFPTSLSCFKTTSHSASITLRRTQDRTPH